MRVKKSGQEAGASARRQEAGVGTKEVEEGKRSVSVEVWRSWTDRSVRTALRVTVEVVVFAERRQRACVEDDATGHAAGAGDAAAMAVESSIYTLAEIGLTQGITVWQSARVEGYGFRCLLTC